MISGGLESGGEEPRLRKLYAHECLVLGKRRYEEPSLKKVVISFTEDDAAHVKGPHNDPLVVMLRVENVNVHKVLVDTGSSVDVMLWSTFEKLKIDPDKLQPYNVSTIHQSQLRAWLFYP